MPQAKGIWSRKEVQCVNENLETEKDHLDKKSLNINSERDQCRVYGGASLNKLCHTRIPSALKIKFLSICSFSPAQKNWFWPE